MPNVFIESFDEFTQRMGSNPVYIKSRWLFANGGQSFDGRIHHRDPPEDSLALRLEFAEDRMRAYFEAFKRDRGVIRMQLDWAKMGAGPLPDPGWEADLERLRRSAIVWKHRYHALKAEMDARRPSLSNDPAVNSVLHREQKIAEARAALHRIDAGSWQPEPTAKEKLAADIHKLCDYIDEQHAGAVK